MANEVVKKLDSETIIECKDFELKEGSLDNKVWIETINDQLRVSLDVDEYISIMETLKKALKENIELKLEREIMMRAPKDFDDVKAVVLEEMKNSNDSIYKIVDKVAREHPNLFYQFNDIGGLTMSEMQELDDEEIPF